MRGKRLKLAGGGLGRGVGEEGDGMGGDGRGGAVSEGEGSGGKSIVWLRGHPPSQE